ncbi:MAG: cob(I)yrinic acid a,c-diamide adenosyltransferase [Cyanobacteriota bacterium]|nr:cob(I)yrinic acid a,c-diamide adenosyltransferase [Cyanobacteriota bacterium]
MTARLAPAHPAHPAPRNEAASRSLRLLQTPAPHLPPQPEGLLQIHTAPHRGSFAMVLSQALRSAGLGSRVLVCQLLKGGVDQGIEGSPVLCGRLRWLRPATPLCLEVAAEALDLEPVEAARTGQAVREVWAYSREQLLEGKLDQLVLDELGLAIELGYLPLEEVVDTLERRPPQLDVIITGPAVPDALLAMADQITELRRLT